MQAELVRELEQVVVEAWPAAERAELDGWLLRASGGPTHRGNSVATLQAGQALSLAARIDAVEAWYRERAQPPMFQLGPCVAPADLDRALAARGYALGGDACLAVAAPEAVAANTLRSAGIEARVERVASDAWLGVSGRSTRFAASYDVLLGFLARLGARCHFATAYLEGSPAAVGLGIESKDRLGIYAMHTVLECRRRGAARALLHELAESALTQGLREVYLLFDAGNTAACTLYAASGFRDLYRYHYRVLPEKT